MANITHSTLTGGDLHVPQAHAASHVGSDQIQSATSAQSGLATALQVTKLDAIEPLADVTDAANVSAAGATVAEDYNANTIVLAAVDDTPVVTTIAESEMIGRLPAGTLGALTAVDTRTLLNVGDGADCTANNAPQAHAASHGDGQSDAIALDTFASPTDNTLLNTSTVRHGLMPKLSGSSGDRIDGLGAWVSTPPDHAIRHASAGADPIKLDDLASPDDNTDLNASTSAHGLLLKLDNVSTNFMNGTGAWSAPTLSEDAACTAIDRGMSSFEMVRMLMSGLTAPVILWAMEGLPTGTCADWSGNTHTGTYNGSMVAGDRVNQGRVYMLDLNGSSQYVSVADSGDFSFGTGSADVAVSFAAVIEVVSTESGTIISKHATGGEEYIFALTNGQIYIRFYDDSASAHIEMLSDAALSAGKHLVVATYDATAAHSGITLYVDGATVAATGSLVGTYTAMEDLGEAVRVGARGGGVYFPNDIGFALIEESELSAADVWLMWLTVKAYYNL